MNRTVVSKVVLNPVVIDPFTSEVQINGVGIGRIHLTNESDCFHRPYQYIYTKDGKEVVYALEAEDMTEAVVIVEFLLNKNQF